MVVIQPKCARCGEPLIVVRLKDEKWEKSGRRPAEGRPIQYCRACARTPKAKNIAQVISGKI